MNDKHSDTHSGTRTDEASKVYTVEPKFSPMTKWILSILATIIAAVAGFMIMNMISDSRQTADNARDALTRYEQLSQRVDELPERIAQPLSYKLDQLSADFQRALSTANEALPKDDAQQFRSQMAEVNSQQWAAIRELERKQSDMNQTFNGITNEVSAMNGKMDLLLQHFSGRGGMADNSIYGESYEWDQPDSTSPTRDTARSAAARTIF